MNFSEKIGILGFGVIGEALAKSMVKSRILPEGALCATDPQPERLAAAEALGLGAFSDASELTGACGVILIAVKPQDMRSLLEGIRSSTREDQLFISIAAGVPTSFIETALGGRIPVIRVMPNLACVVGEGMLALARGRWSVGRHVETATRLLSPSGRVIEVDESMMDAVTGLSGSGPAFVAVVVQALADAGVRVGLHRKTATTLAIQTVLGASKTLSETGIHPEVLKDMIASPGGTAIAGVHALESGGLRAAIIDAVVAATERSRELGGKSFQG